MTEKTPDHKLHKTAIWTVQRAPLYAPPGTLTVSSKALRPAIRVIAYGPDKYVDQPIEDPSAIAKGLHKLPVTWVNVDGLGDVATIRALGEIFGLHKLALEDVVHVGQRPKVDEFDQFFYIVARMIDRVDGKLDTEQLSVFVGKDYLLTFQERPGDCLDAIRLRIKEKRGRIREAGPDYLAYCILDALIDDYFPVLEATGDKLEKLEDETLERPRPACAAGVHMIKRDLLLLRRAMWPLREAVGAVQRGTSPFIKDASRIQFFRDCYDHTVQVLDLVEVYRELCTGLIEMYMTSISHRMNQIIKVLTIISTIFIPLTFIAGIYGMNFEAPEFKQKWGYPMVLALMAVVGLGLLYFFWRSGWLKREDKITSSETEPSKPKH